MQIATSPNGGSARARQELEKRFERRLAVNPNLTRKIVSYQGNRRVPGLRWMKYKEGFSQSLVESLLDEFQPTAVLDPFAGIGTAPLIAAGRGMRTTGIEIMPVGALVGNGIAHAANGLSQEEFEKSSKELLNSLKSSENAPREYEFRHVRITESAFPEETENAIAKARHFIANISDPVMQSLLNLACMTVLEDVSYTRKDGQYLRWDYRSGRTLRSKVNKGPILPFSTALGSRMYEILQDIEPIKHNYGGGYPEFITGSSLELLRNMPYANFDMVITSPPYANRYDYTRTYALELAWLGYEQNDFLELRQSMLSATVENRPKRKWLKRIYGNDSEILNNAFKMYDEQEAVHEALTVLRDHIGELGNRHIIRLIEGYFLEMAVIIAELGRIVSPGGVAIMVNDNVQYHGEEIPVDMILSDFAERSGFRCDKIWTLPRGKGNSSQQMRRFGRKEIRKCVYQWVRLDDESS